MIQLREFRKELSPVLMLLFRRIFDIREGETIRAGLMFLYIFFTISTLLIIKPVSYALFLAQFGAAQLPFAFILVSLFAVFFSVYYSRKVKKENLNVLITRTLTVWIICLLVFWFLLFFNIQRGIALYLLFIWVAIFALVSTSQFWILANIIFNAREAKRLFGFIGAGAIAGGIFGGYLTNFMAPFLGSENLLFLCMVLLGSCIYIIKVVWNIKSPTDHSNASNGHLFLPVSLGNPFKLIRGSQHLTFLAGIVGISVIVAKLVEYQFSAVASMNISQEDQLTAFFGFWLSNLNIVSLLIQLLLTRHVVGVFGVGTSLYFLPVGILIGALFIVIQPALWSAIFIKICDGSLKQSINKAGMELLALPIPIDIKNQAKSFIDIFIDSLATGFSGLLLVLVIMIFNLSITGISIIIMLLIMLWIYFIMNMKKEYIRSIRLNIDLQQITGKEIEPDLKNESVIGGLIKILESKNKNNIIRVLRMVKQIRNDRLVSHFANLLKHQESEIRLEVLQNLYFYKENYSRAVEKLIFDPDDRVKVEAFHYLFQHRVEKRTKLLQRFLTHEDYTVRSAALICAARESRNNTNMRKNFRIKDRIEEEIVRIKSEDNKQTVNQIKKTCAMAIGVADIPDLHPFLHILLHESSPDLLRTAIVSAGQSRKEEFVPVLIGFLKNKGLLKELSAALTNFQPQIFDVLHEHLKNPLENKHIRSSIPYVLLNMGTQRSVDILTLNLDQADPVLRFNIVKALYQLRMKDYTLHFDHERIVRHILAEAKEYTQIWTVFYKQINSKTVQPAEDKSFSVSSETERMKRKLIKDLESRLDSDLERIFILLGLKYPPDDIYNIYLGLKSKDGDTRINAIELLDNILEVDLKKVIIPIVESSLVDALINETLARLGLKVPSEFDCLVMLLTGDDPLLQLDSLNIISQLNDDRYIRYVGQLVNNPDSKIKKRALAVLKSMAFTGAY